MRTPSSLAHSLSSPVNHSSNTAVTIKRNTSNISSKGTADTHSMEHKQATANTPSKGTQGILNRVAITQLTVNNKLYA